MADGSTKPIEQVKPGDWVLSRPQEEADGYANQAHEAKPAHIQAKRVARTFVHSDAKTLVLHLQSGEQVTTTLGHLFVVEGKGLIPARQLEMGNAIVTRTGPAVTIVSIEHPTKTVTVYNLEVEDYHTYFVGNTNGGLWVHNDCTDIALQKLKQVGEGSIVRVEPDGPITIGESDPVTGDPVFYHDVYTHNGIVHDPMRGYPQIPFDDWWQTFQYRDALRVRYLEPQDLMLRGRLRF